MNVRINWGFVLLAIWAFVAVALMIWALLSAAIDATAATRYHGPVTASWYGPGLYGNHTACGQILRPGTVGVAHRSLPCGTKLRLKKRGHVVRVRVIDRGPYNYSRTFDLTRPVKNALGCGDLCSIRWRRGWGR